ncbi:hypothetical protein DFA_03049 [Cavenderia fasciculata]|uniref:Uncharacterized protein n=1 Tax=Cavenderia fasciculata TaxID=261658 RepID=F4PGH1_CACFS|nr:uncharacterized protein DFA_03049 [Cavenderia fasciculata]EGG24805.1 hypothetical protein DFA_03049 [Cavenderia fasciculata]|eukprot:XP_004362656.1 hypothetical protein DFA_03049 [Cavenderia fasciculata]
MASNVGGGGASQSSNKPQFFWLLAVPLIATLVRGGLDIGHEVWNENRG